jgi:REP element-mobilizing transposase RayT
LRISYTATRDRLTVSRRSGRHAGTVTTARAHLVAPDAPGFYHCVSRCVRRAFLCGVDHYSGRSFEHRKAWVEDRLLELASHFAVSLYAYAVMSNHVHVVVRVDPEAARSWSDTEVAERWARLFPRKDETDGERELRVAQLSADPVRLALLRTRLGSLSWFMRCLTEPIARLANAEDACKGRFWEGRFKCQALLDEAAVLAAMAYVDLNPVRAGIATELRECTHTSVAARLRDVEAASGQAHAPAAPVAGVQPLLRLPVTTAEYIELVDWTGRQVRPDQRGVIAADAPAALGRIATSGAAWTAQVLGVRSKYWRAIGAAQTLIDRAGLLGQRWLKGTRFEQALSRV